MNEPNQDNSLKVLMADDDPDDCLLIREAFEVAGIACELRMARDGRELAAYLIPENSGWDEYGQSLADIVLLDLNMPRKDGREILEEINRKKIVVPAPIIVFTTSRAEEDVRAAYVAGVAAYVIKPDNFDKLLEFVNRLKDYRPGSRSRPFPEALRWRPVRL